MSESVLLLTAPKEKKEKEVASKILVEEGYSVREVAKILGVEYTKVWRDSKKETPEELQQFATNFKEVLAKNKQLGLAKVLKRMHEIIPGYQRLDHLVKTAEYFEGIRPGNNVNISGEKVIAILGEMEAE